MYVCRENQRCSANKALWTEFPKSCVLCVRGVGWNGAIATPDPPLCSPYHYTCIFEKRGRHCAGACEADVETGVINTPLLPLAYDNKIVQPLIGWGFEDWGE